MLERSFVIGLSHKDAPVDVREKLGAISETEALNSIPLLGEAMVLSTCNRYEIYATAGEGISLSDSMDSVRSYLREKTGICPQGWEAISFHKTGADMLSHGFSVASSLESMVLGEPQILGQMKNAYNIAKTGGHVSSFMERFCNVSFRVGKRVRTETAIAQNSVSVASTAVRLAVHNVLDIKTARVVLLGAGDMIVSAIKHLEVVGATDITIVNRNVAKARRLAADYESRIGSKIQVLSFDAIVEVLTKADVVITATASLSPIVTTALMQSVLSSRPVNNLPMIDIAVPRDVSRDVDAMNGVMVLDIDDLGRYVESAKQARKQQVGKAKDIITEEVGAFVTWNDAQKNAHMLKFLREHAEGLRSEVTSKYPSADVDAATRLLMNKLLHAPMQAIKDGHASAGSMEHIVALLFGIRCPRRVQFLPNDTNSTTKQSCPFMREMIKTSENWDICPITGKK